VLSTAVLRFNSITIAMPTFESIITSIMIGTVCGLIGSGWIIGNTYINMFRKVHMSGQLSKCLEVLVLSLFTTTMFYWLPFWA